MVDWSRGQEGRFGQATAEGKQEQSKADAGSPSSWDVTTVERSGQGSAEYGAGGVSCGDPPGTSGAFVFPTAKRFRSSRDFWSSGSSWTGALPRATLLRPFQGLSVRQGSALSRGRWTCPEGAQHVSTGQRPVLPHARIIDEISLGDQRSPTGTRPYQRIIERRAARAPGGHPRTRARPVKSRDATYIWNALEATSSSSLTGVALRSEPSFARARSTSLA